MKKITIITLIILIFLSFFKIFSKFSTASHLSSTFYINANKEPSNTGYVTIDKLSNYPTTVVMAGDSLARGKGGNVTHGQLDTIGYYLVNHANSLAPGIAQYRVVPGLSVDGSSVEQLNKKLNTHVKTIVKIPNLILILSFTNKDLQNFVLDAEKIKSPLRFTEFFRVIQTLNRDSNIYQKSLALLVKTLGNINKKRELLLGSNNAKMQILVLGLPNEAYSPRVQHILRRYHISYGEFQYVINVFNYDNRQAVILGNKSQYGVTYSFVNLDRIHISAKKALSELSPDKFHPNYLGYESLTSYTEYNVYTRINQRFALLAHKQKLSCICSKSFQI